MKSAIRDKIIKNGVNNLIQFGYEYVNSENILTDEVYKEFFKAMIKSNLGRDKKVDFVLNELMKELE